MNKKGLTLIELLAVIIILGILMMEYLGQHEWTSGAIG